MPKRPGSPADKEVMRAHEKMADVCVAPIQVSNCLSRAHGVTDGTSCLALTDILLNHPLVAALGMPSRLSRDALEALTVLLFTSAITNSISAPTA